MNDTASSVAHLSVFLSFFFFRYDDINEWLNNEEPNAFLWMLTDYLSADGLISCWVHVLYDSTAPCPGLSPPATSRPGIPVLVQRSHCFRSSATSLLPVLLSFCSFLCSSVLSYLCVSVFFNAYSCPCVRVRLPSAVSLGESLPENNRLFFLLEHIDQNVLRFEAKPRLSINIWWFETVWHWTLSK